MESLIQPKPYLHFFVDLRTARSSSAIRDFAQRLVGEVIEDSDVVYAFLDLGLRERIPHPELYFAGQLHNRLSWELLVENEAWHQTSDRDRARGVYWGNVFGPGMASRLLQAGFDQGLQALKESWPWSPVVLQGSSGAIAVLIDDDPIAFARDRARKLNSDAGAVKAGAFLCRMLSKAGLF